MASHTKPGRLLLRVAHGPTLNTFVIPDRTSTVRSKRRYAGRLRRRLPCLGEA